MQYVTEYDVTNIADTRPRKNMITIGKVDTSDLMMIITWAINISFQSPELKWVSWAHTAPYILMTKVIERTSSMLDTPPQDKLYWRLQVFNACEHCWIMMIMGGSKMSKTEYDLKAICILPMTYPKNCAIQGGNYNIQQPRLPPNNAGRPVRQLGASYHEGYTGPDAGIWPYANRMEKHAYQGHFDGKIYKWKHTCWVSIVSRVPSMVIMQLWCVGWKCLFIPKLQWRNRWSLGMDK